MFIGSLVALSFAASAAYASPVHSTLTARAVNVKDECIVSGIEGSCAVLTNACLSAVGDGQGKENKLWYQKSCVAAATCYGVGNLVDKVSCQVGYPVLNQNQISLDYNIYAGIVGQCAWSSTGCPIREQWFVDFYYGTLTELGSNTWPDSSLNVVAWYYKIVDWASTGETIPYLNFNDWLHYSTYPSGVVNTTAVTLVPTVPTSLPLTSPTLVSTVRTSPQAVTSPTPVPTSPPAVTLPSPDLTLPGTISTVVPTAATTPSA